MLWKRGEWLIIYRAAVCFFFIGRLWYECGRQLIPIRFVKGGDGDACSLNFVFNRCKRIHILESCVLDAIVSSSFLNNALHYLWNIFFTILIYLTIIVYLFDAQNLQVILMKWEHLRSAQAALLYFKQCSINLSSTSSFLGGTESAITAWNAVNAIVPETVERITDVDEVWRETICFRL